MKLPAASGIKDGERENMKSTIGTTLTGGSVPNGKRINAACWLDGNDDELIIEFWALPGSILRTCYDRRSTITRYTFISPHDENFARLQWLAECQDRDWQI